MGMNAYYSNQAHRSLLNGEQVGPDWRASYLSAKHSMAPSSAWTFTLLCVLSVTHGQLFRKEKSVVTTEGGTATTGSYCHFPFTMSGIQYNECVPDPNHRLWCGTTADVETDGQWGYCMTARHVHIEISFSDEHDEDDADKWDQWETDVHEGEMDEDDDNHDFWDEPTSNGLLKDRKLMFFLNIVIVF
uniref:Fibronectin type-II domain-containing protein n=1 Tax=Eptatretus burgeri TaxID=7764 RepID=A0A8C4QU23_EPTBU